MKKRIISLILVVAMAVIALASCGYSYAKDDMSKYATFDKAAFLAALADGSIKIEDATFGVDEDNRQLQVLDTIFSTVAKEADTTVKVTEGVVGKYDLLYYCYYATATVDGKEHVFYASKMSEGSPTNFQLGLSTHEGVNAEIVKLVEGKDLKEFIYTTITADNAETADVVENLTKAGDVVYVSYTKEYTQKAFDNEGNPIMSDGGVQATETKKVTVTYEKLTLDGADGTFKAALVDKKVGTTQSFDIVDASLGFATDAENTVKYTNVKVDWIVDNEKEIGSFTYTPYTAEADKDKTETDVYGEKVKVKDVEFTYHIFPVYTVAVADELTAEMVLEYFYKSVISTEEHSDDEEESEGEEHKHPYSFDSLQNGNYKNGEKTLAELCEELVTLRTELSDAEKAQETAQKAVDKAGTAATDSEKNALADANKKVEEAKTKVNEKVTAILACQNEENGDVKAALVQDLKTYQYETLEDTYESTIKQSIAKEVWALAEKYITPIKNEDGEYVLPKKAVRNAFKRIENNHKYNFYEGNYESDSSSSSSSSSSESNYKHYNGDYDEYLKVKYFGSDASKYSVADARDKMTEEAEQSVIDIIRVYTLVSLYGEEKDLSVTDKQIDDFKLTYLWYFYGSIMTEDDYKTALLLDNLMNYILEVNEEAEENKVDYVRVEYDFKAEDAEETETPEGDGE